MLIRRPERRHALTGARGFSVLDMLITLSLVGITTGLASPAISKLRSQYQLEGFSRQIAMEVSKARMQAIAQNRTIRLRTTSLRSYVLEGSQDGSNFAQVTEAISLPTGMLVLQGSTGGPHFDRQGMSPAVTNIYLVNGAGVQTIQTNRLGRVSRF